MGLFHFVEKHERIRPTPHGLGELAAGLVADVSRRGTNEPGDGVLLAILRHIDAHHGGFIVEEEVRQRLRQLRLTHAGGAEEEEGAGRAVGVSHARAGATHGIGNSGHGLALADDPLTQHRFHVQQLLGLALQHLAGGNAGPRGDDLRDGIRADLLIQHGIALGSGLFLGCCQVLFQRRYLAVVDLGG